MKNKVYTNASIVTTLSVFERSLGFFYRIVLSRLIGAEGLGLYQIALSLFALFMTLGTGGIPITVSRMIAKSKAENNKLGESGAFSAGLILCLLLTLPVCFFLGLFGDKLPFLFSDKRAFSVFRILLIGLSFTCVYGIFKGYFWGNKNFLLPSILEIAEETVMVIVGILLLQNVSSPLGGAQKAAWAVLISYLFSFTAAFVCFLVKGGSISSPKKQLKSLFNSSMPITSVRASNSLIASAVAVILPAMLLKTGFSESEALQQFGIITGMVIPILFIPATLIGSISLVLVPELSEDFYKHNQERLLKNIQRGIKFSFLTACIFLPFFYAFGEDIGKIAFSNVQAGVLIRKSCFILPAMCLAMISTSILNSMGFERKTFLFYLLGEAGMLVCIFFLPSVCGIFSYTLGMTASFFITGALNLFFLQKKFNIFKKEQGQVRDYSFSRALLLLFPLSFFGQFISSLCKKFAGGFLALVFAALILTIATLFVYLFFIFPCKKRRKKS